MLTAESVAICLDALRDLRERVFAVRNYALRATSDDEAQALNPVACAAEADLLRIATAEAELRRLLAEDANCG